MPTFAFSGAVAETPGYGQKHKIRFADTWAAADTWSVQFTSTLLGNFTLGKGYIAGQTFTCGFKLKTRMFLGFGSSFALSAVEDSTLWEEQNPGTAVIRFLSQFGAQDAVVGFAAFEGKLVVFGAQSTQIWQVDADPSNFVLLQTLDYTGTLDEDSIQGIGDSDVFYLDRTGVRSIKAKELASNAYIDDIGVAIDALVKVDIAAAAINTTSVIEPATKQYWLYINNHIYVLSRHPGSKIQAWSLIKPTYQLAVSPNSANYNGSGLVTYNVAANTSYYWVAGSGETQLVNESTTLTSSFGFLTTAGGTATVTGVPSAAVTGTLYANVPWTPAKFVVYQGQIYTLNTTKEVMRYGGAANNSYDHSRMYFELPWMDLGQMSNYKQGLAMDAIFTGKWYVDYSLNPTSSNFFQAIFRGSPTTPLSVNDSTFDKGRYALSGHGTHIKMRGVSYSDASVIFGGLNVTTQQSNRK